MARIQVRQSADERLNETQLRTAHTCLDAGADHTVLNASVGDRRAARNAGSRPATAPMANAAPSPPAHATVGTVTAQCLVVAYTAVDAAPSATPMAPPATDSSTASDRNWARIWPLVAPSARRRPISERRSSTEMTMMLATPTPATSNATAPSPRNRSVSAPLAWARATSASDGWLTLTASGCSGLAVEARTPCTAAVRSVTDRT